MNPHLPWKIVGSGLALFLLFPFVLYAEVTGSISGVVTDPSGANVPNAVVILRSGETGLERKIQANKEGAYEFLAVPVGENYSVRVEAPRVPSGRAKRHQARSEPEIQSGFQIAGRRSYGHC